MKCTVRGCENPVLVKSRGWCRDHYGRWQRHGHPLAGRINGEPAQWLQDLVAQEGWSDQCIDWPFGHDRNGYGALSWGSRSALAHRVVLELCRPWHPPLARNALHQCDRRPCVNPRHLYWGTHQRNALDAAERKGMGRGENGPKAKLTEAQVREIRERYALGGITYRSLAAEFSVHETSISQIVRRKTWAHI